MIKIAVITGTTHGIGRVTARELARAGHIVVMLCRNLELAQIVRDEIYAAVASASIHTIHCDLSSLASVRKAAAEVRRQFGQIGLLINNGGISTTRRQLSADGFELTFATNHLGPFLLTSLLLDRIEAGGRIVNLSSRAHYRGHLDLNGVTDPRARFNPVAAYAQSKLANTMHTFALARRLAGTPVTVNCLHPGVVETNLLPRWLRMIKPLLSPVIFDAERGAQTTLHLALSEKLAAVSGLYFDENQNPQTASVEANDIAQQESLWTASERWGGLCAEPAATRPDAARTGTN